MDIKTKDYTRVVTGRCESQPSNFLLWYGQENRRGGGALWTFFVKLVPIDMAVCSDHADSFELDHFDQNFHLNDTVLEASIYEYDRYEPPPGERSCLRYIEF